LARNHNCTKWCWKLADLLVLTIDFISGSLANFHFNFVTMGESCRGNHDSPTDSPAIMQNLRMKYINNSIKILAFSCKEDSYKKTAVNEKR